VSSLLERELVNKVDKKTAEQTLIIITSDHGHIYADPEKILYINGDKKLFDMFKLDSNGMPILPTGSPRNLFLNIETAQMDNAFKHLNDKYGKLAKVMITDDAIAKGLFGTGKVNKKFKDRVGDIMLLPYGNNEIWYEHVPGRKVNYWGMHGGLSADEMLIPLGMARLSDIL
jgi:predicted AlkP superfamily pyrophosphatase or phosphodiesterase